MDQVVGKATLFGKRPGEEPFQITIEIGTPYRRDIDVESWACPVSVSPLYKKLADMQGVDSLQALCEAIALARSLLEGFREEGGALSYDGESDSFRFYGS